MIIQEKQTAFFQGREVIVLVINGNKAKVINNTPKYQNMPFYRQLNYAFWCFTSELSLQTKEHQQCEDGK